MTQRAPTRGRARDRILDLAEAAVLSKGFGATSIEELIVGAGITKSGFFYHFREKSDLARALLEREVARDAAALEAIFDEAARAHADPLDAFLAGLEGYAKAAMRGVRNAHPGCLAAAFSYEAQLIGEDAKAASVAGMTQRRAALRRRIDAVAKSRPGAEKLDLAVLADMALALFQGALIVNKVLHEQDVLSRQIKLYQTYVRRMFAEAQPA
jgi:AcrR family transcriptional regulator